MIYGYIYKIATTKSNKVYIGQTTKTVEKRFAEHLKNSTEKSKNTLHLYLAMNLYGKETFFVEQIDVAENRSDLNNKERYWINFYDSINNGYNMIEGGNDINPMSSKIVKEKHDAKMRSEEVRSKISKTMHELRTTVGFSEDHKQKIKESRKKRKEIRAALGLKFYDDCDHCKTRSRKVYCVLDCDKVLIFDSIKDAGRWWYDHYKPFGEIYSTATYQRKIEASIAGKDIEYGNKTHMNYKKITNIKWYYVV